MNSNTRPTSKTRQQCCLNFPERNKNGKKTITSYTINTELVNELSKKPTIYANSFLRFSKYIFLIYNAFFD